MASAQMMMMMMCCMVVAAVLVVGTAGEAANGAATEGTLTLLVAYCPTLTTNAGAVVEVDTVSGDIKVGGSFTWPGEAVFGCVADYDPNVAVAGSSIWLNFVADDGVFVEVDLDKGAVAGKFSAGDPFFTGFETFGLVDRKLLGISGTVTQSGLCDDGCFQYGAMDLDGKYKAGENILFKEMSDDVHYITDDTFYVQAGYDLREEKCAPEAADECLLKLDVKTGELIEATFTNYTVYAYAGVPVLDARVSAGPIVQAWMAGFADECPSENSPNPGFAFGTVDLSTAKATKTACLASNATIDMDEWVASFSADGSLFATGSGNAYGDPSQLLVVDTASGKPVFQSELKSLPKTLGAAQNLIWIWSVTWKA